MEYGRPIVDSISKTYFSASAYAYHFFLRHSTVILAVAGIAIIIHGLEQYSWAETGGAAGAGNGTRGGVTETGSRVGSSAAGGIPVNGNPINACARNIGYLEGGFGTLIASAAGIGAIISAAVGGFKAAWCLFVVSVGTFILRTFLYLFLTGC